MTANGRGAIVTGAASGIGAATVDRLSADPSYEFVACLDVDETVHDRYEEIDRCQPSTVDIRDCDAVQAVVEAAAERAALDTVINAAGVSAAVNLPDLSASEWDRVLDVNLKGQFNVVRTCAPYLRERESYVVNVSSTAGQVGSASGGVHYSASKAGILGLTKGLAKELGPVTRVNAVVPGLIETPLLTDSNLWTDDDLDVYTGDVPLRRIGTADEVARVIEFLCDDGAAYMTGSIVNVDGGSVLR